jgi:hypothetical protein
MRKEQTKAKKNSPLGVVAFTPPFLVCRDQLNYIGGKDSLSTVAANTTLD